MDLVAFPSDPEALLACAWPSRLGLRGPLGVGQLARLAQVRSKKHAVGGGLRRSFLPKVASNVS
jgi:hypothetical protein